MKLDSTTKIIEMGKSCLLMPFFFKAYNNLTKNKL